MISVLECDFSNNTHRVALIKLMNDYMADDMGDNLPPYTKHKEEQVLSGLENHPSKLILLVQSGEEFIGLANCFINFGTFTGKPFINIHDVIVQKGYRGKGIGKILFEEITRKALDLDCSKVTLEVREDNTFAQKLYRKMGYDESKPKMHFWTKYLSH